MGPPTAGSQSQWKEQRQGQGEPWRQQPTELQGQGQRPQGAMASAKEFRKKVERLTAMEVKLAKVTKPGTKERKEVWVCPATGCGYNTWVTKSTCHKCGEPRPQTQSNKAPAVKDKDAEMSDPGPSLEEQLAETEQLVALLSKEKNNATADTLLKDMKEKMVRLRAQIRATKPVPQRYQAALARHAAATAQLNDKKRELEEAEAKAASAKSEYEAAKAKEQEVRQEVEACAQLMASEGGPKRETPAQAVDVANAPSTGKPARR